MSALKLLLASDMHYCADLRGEMALAGSLLPADTYDHLQGDRLVWHNTMLVEQMEHMFDALERLIQHESPDLVIFTGDLVNTNWAPNVSAVAARLSALSCPTRLVTGNHDVYLAGIESRLQEQIKPGEYATGFRHEFADEVGLMYLDLFVHHADGSIAKTTDPQDRQARAQYRQQDISDALTLLEAWPGRRFLVIGHFPMLPPDGRLEASGRKIGWTWPSGAALGQRLGQSANLLGVVCGHQHFAHYQRRENSFHWTVPALVEYPCAAGILTIDDAIVSGRLTIPDETLSELSLSAMRAEWPAGAKADQKFSIVHRF